MARTPNYRFERQERDRAKALKKAAKKAALASGEVQVDDAEGADADADDSEAAAPEDGAA